MTKAVDLDRETLYELYYDQELSQREIAEKLGCTQGCISKKMDEMDLQSRYNGFWSDGELEAIEEYYPDKEKLVREIDRTWNAIKLKAMDLGLAKSSEERDNSKEVKERLRQLADDSKIKVDFSKEKEISYILGVVDGDGYTDRVSTIGLEVKDIEFADKFESSLNKVGFNPGRGRRRGKYTVWASSKDFVSWLTEFTWETKYRWLGKKGDPWAYIEGAYDSDGNLSQPGPRICSYSESEKMFLHRLLKSLDLECNIQQNNVYVPTAYRDVFFENVNPVLENRRLD